MSAGVFAVVKFHIDHRGAFKTDPGLDDTVLRGDFESVHGGVSGDFGFAVSRRNILVASLGAFQCAVFDRKGGNDLVPHFGRFGALEVIREDEFLLFGNGLGGDDGQICGEDRGAVVIARQGRMRMEWNCMKRDRRVWRAEPDFNEGPMKIGLEPKTTIARRARERW